MRAAFTALVAMALVTTVAPSVAAAPQAPAAPTSPAALGVASGAALTTQTTNDPHFFDTDDNGWVEVQRPSNVSFAGIGDSVYRYEDTRDASGGYDYGFRLPPEDNTLQSVRRMAAWPDAPAAEVVDSAVGFLTDWESPDLIVLRGADGRWLDRGPTPPPTSLTWYGPQSGSFKDGIDIDLGGVTGTPVGVEIVNSNADLDPATEIPTVENFIVLATSDGLYLFDRGCGTADGSTCPPPATGDSGFSLQATKRFPDQRILGIHHDPVWARSATENLGDGIAETHTWFGVVLSNQREFSPDLYDLTVEILEGVSVGTSDSDLAIATPKENFGASGPSNEQVSPVRTSPVLSLSGTPVGADLRFRIGMRKAPGDTLEPTIRTDINVTLSDRTTTQFSGHEYLVSIGTPEPAVFPLRPITSDCGSRATGFDAVYYDATPYANVIEAEVMCATPSITVVRLGGYYLRQYPADEGNNQFFNRPYTPVQKGLGATVNRPQVSLAQPCVEQLRFETTEQSGISSPVNTVRDVLSKLADRRDFMATDGFVEEYRCSARLNTASPSFIPPNNNFYVGGGHVQATVQVGFGAGVSPTGLSPRADEGEAVLLTWATEEPEQTGQPSTFRNDLAFPTRTDVPPGLAMLRLSTADVIERVQLTGATANCLKEANPAERESCTPRLAASAPVPVAVMAAPPYVKGTGQAAQITPEFARGSSSTEEQVKSTSSSVGVEFEVSKTFKEPFFNLASLEISAGVGYERSSEESTGTSLTIETLEGYGGSLDNDTIVVNNAEYLEYGGIVMESSAGATCERNPSTGICDPIPTNIRMPIGTTTTSQTLADLLRTPATAQWWAPGTPFGDELGETLTHTAGMPGTYLGGSGDPDAELNDFCIGNLNPADGFAEVAKGDPVAANPFKAYETISETAPQILTSEWQSALAGEDLTTVRAFVSWEKGASASSLQSNTISSKFSVEGKWGGGVAQVGVAATLSASGSFSNSFTSSLGENTEFSGSVGSIPDIRLTDEQFGWRMFVCKREIAPGLKVWVQNYQVRNYGGIYQEPGVKPPEDLGPLDAVAPVRSLRTDLTPIFEWDQPVGTVKDYDVEVEAVGTEDYRTYDNVVEFADYPTSSARPDAASWELPSTEPLRQNQLYRWRVKSNNFFFGSEDSSWEYFVTEGPPEAELSIADYPGYGVAGKPVKLRRGGSDGGLPVTTSWKVNGAEVASSATGNTDGFDWVPAAPGRYEVSVEVSNALGSSEDGRTVVVAPDAAYDTYTTDEDTLMDVAAPGVLANDNGAETAALSQETVAGELTFSPDGAFTWMPEADKCASDGADSFLYRPTGGGITSPAEGLVALYVDCVDDPPVAVDDAFSTDEDDPISAGAPGVIANDTDIDLAAGEQLTAELVTDAANGDLVLNADGSFDYTPDADFCGEDSFTYRVINGAVDGDVATVELTVDCVDDPPRGTADSYGGFANDTVTVPTPGVLGNDTDVDAAPGDVLTAQLVSDATDGTVSLQPNGSFTYTPDADTCGEDTFSYQPFNGAVGGDPVTVTLDVSCDERPVEPDDEPTTPTTAPPTTTPQPATPPSGPPPAGDTCPTGPILLTPENRDAAGLAMWACGMELVGTIWRGEGVLVLLPRGFYSCPAVPQRFWFDTRAEFGFFLLQAKCGYTPLFANTWFGRWLAWDPPA